MQNAKKLSLKEFNNIKNKLNKIYEKFLWYKKLSDEDHDEYIRLQQLLLSYDLSDIPFESYTGMEFWLSSDEELIDFSKSHANLDFRVIEVKGFGNYKGCNVKNVEGLEVFKITNSIFDNDAVINNPKVFLSDKFSSEFKNKFNRGKITIEDLVSLSLEQIDELKENKMLSNCFSNRYSFLLNGLGIEKAISLYNYSKDDYEYIREIFNYQYINFRVNQHNFFNEMITADNSKAREICNRYVRKIVLNPRVRIDVDNFPDSFVKENNDLFMLDIYMPSELRNKYYEKKLRLNDLIENIEILENVDIEYFLRGFCHEAVFAKKLGSKNFINLVKKHYKFFQYLSEKYNGFSDFVAYYKHSDNYEEAFANAAKNYALNNELIRRGVYSSDDEYIIPDFLSSFNFEIVVNYRSMDDMSKYSSNIILMNRNQRTLIETFGLDNLIRFDRDTNFFSYREFYVTSDEKIVYETSGLSRGWRNMNNLGKFLTGFSVNFESGSYEEFEKIMAELLDVMRVHKQFFGNKNYDIIEGQFREKYKHIFIDKNAPQELRNAFYINDITPSMIKKYREYIWCLADKDLSKLINGKYMVSIYNLTDEERQLYSSSDSYGKVNFIEYYSKRFGNMELLKLISIYGDLFSDLCMLSINNNSSQKRIDKSLRYEFYRKITSSLKIDYKSLSLPLELGGDPEFVKDFPGIFIDEKNIPIDNEKQKEAFITSFYDRVLLFSDFYNKPELANYLKDKNMKFLFGRYAQKRFAYNSYNSLGIRRKTEINLIDIIGDEKFLILCSKYGRYLEKLYFDKENISPYTPLDKICEMIEECIYNNCLEGRTWYTPQDAPKFMMEKHPDLFLSDDAPQDLKDFYYFELGWHFVYCFTQFSRHKDWLPYLKGKHYKALFLKTIPDSNNVLKNYNDYFDWLGEDKALEFGMKKPDTVFNMITSSQVNLMREWYDRTGQKFVPDYVVMQSFPKEEIDKFLNAASNWGKLIKIKNFSDTPEGRDALLKLAYSFGVFDHDRIGMKKLEELLTSIPRHLSGDEYKILTNLELEVYNYENASLNEKIARIYSEPSSYSDFVKLRYELISENIISSKEDNVMSSLFRENEDGTITLKINVQGQSKIKDYLRRIMENNGILINRDDAHRLFGGFELKYDKDFREFLLANLDEIRRNPEYTSYVSNIQKQFHDIKTFNSNRHLTLDLAISFIQENKYENVNPGNERVAEISSIAGYSQEDFDTLQMIYNYGKQRTFSSIPRIEKTDGEYTYQMLRLDDPLAMAIGTLTNCCQELGNVAEVCMEHSMTSNDGRVFVIRDGKGNIVAQSWVWRNKDVICFDNIEIPNKAFVRAEEENNGRSVFVNKICNLYKDAAKELMDIDDKMYKILLEEGKITQDEYDGLRLSKITVGIGYNDIAEAIEDNYKMVYGKVVKPVPFKEPVRLSRSLYVNDSSTQYILEEKDRVSNFDGNNICIYSDDYMEYTDDTFDSKMLMVLSTMEIATKDRSYSLNTYGADSDDNKIVSKIANNIELDPGNTRIIMNSNFAIIYEINDTYIKIGDLYFNTRVLNDEEELDISETVIMQIKCALKQIAGNKDIDISLLESNQEDMYKKVINYSGNITSERGLCLIRRR